MVFYVCCIEGPERRSAEIDNKNKQITAYHESGHAIVAYYTKDAMPINKATIMPRGPSLGHVGDPQSALHCTFCNNNQLQVKTLTFTSTSL